MNDGVPMLGLIAVAVAAIVGLFALGVAPRQGSMATNRAWWPSYSSQPAYTSAPSYSGSSSTSSAPAPAPAAPDGQAPQQAPAASEPLQYDGGQSPQQQQGAGPQYGQGQAPPPQQQPQPQQYGPPAQ